MRISRFTRTALCLCPVVFLAVTLCYIPFVESLRPGVMHEYFSVLVYLVFCVLCLLFTIVWVQLRFMLYVIEHTGENGASLLKSAIAFFVREPYHNVFERISDVAMTLQAVLAVVVFAVFIFIGGLI